MNNLGQDLMPYMDAVQIIRNTILKSRYQTAAIANTGMLSLYYGVGRYISENTRTGKWGTGAIETISKQLQGEIPGLRGFSPTNMRNMRIFYEQWSLELNRQSVTGDLERDSKENATCLIHQLATDELGYLDDNIINLNHQLTTDDFWSVAQLKNHIRAGDFTSYGSLPNNFTLTIPDEKTVTIAGCLKVS